MTTNSSKRTFRAEHDDDDKHCDIMATGKYNIHYHTSRFCKIKLHVV